NASSMPGKADTKETSDMAHGWTPSSPGPFPGSRSERAFASSIPASSRRRTTLLSGAWAKAGRRLSKTSAPSPAGRTDAMEKIAVRGFRRAPPLRRGRRAAFACRAPEEAGLPCEARSMGFGDPGSDAYPQRELGTEEAIDMDAGRANTPDALEAFT